MWFSKKEPTAVTSRTPKGQVTTKAAGDAAEQVALVHLRKAGLLLLESNYRTPGRGGGEIDLIMKDTDGTLAFIEVRQRASQSHGGAGASISAVKRKRIIFAARHYLMRFNALPPCRFDVVLIQGTLAVGHTPAVEWLRAAFDAY